MPPKKPEPQAKAKARFTLEDERTVPPIRPVLAPDEFGNILLMLKCGAVEAAIFEFGSEGKIRRLCLDHSERELFANAGLLLESDGYPKIS